jgi:flagellar biosynthesis protein FliP
LVRVSRRRRTCTPAAYHQRCDKDFLRTSKLLSLFLTLFTMMPVIDKVNTQALQPLSANKISFDEAAKRGVEPLREFIVKQTRESDMALMVKLSREALPQTVDDVKLVHLMPAFMLNELRTAFQSGSVVFPPFLLITARPPPRC